MPRGPFLPSEFAATQWSTQQDKADFGNTLLHFIDSGFRQTMFTRKLYQRLTLTFGHIAHYNLFGFWEEWFGSESDHVRFIGHLLQWPCYGDPKFTFSDVERAVQREVRRRNYLCRYQSIADIALRTREIAVLEKLEAKYRRVEVSEGVVSNDHADSAIPITPPMGPIQGTLF